MTYILLFCSLLISVVLVVYCSGEFAETNNDVIDPVLDMLLKGEYDNVHESIADDQETGKVESIMLYPDGVWKCGNCTNMGSMKLLYSEIYEQDTNYDNYKEELNIEIQIGLSLKNMRCITLKTVEDRMDVRVASGECSGEQVTLGVIGAVHCIVSVYG